MAEIYISVDVETDGPIPGANSMLSLGAVALTADRQLLGEFGVNLVELYGVRCGDRTLARGSGYRPGDSADRHTRTAVWERLPAPAIRAPRRRP